MPLKLSPVICMKCKSPLEYEKMDAGGYDVLFVKPCEKCDDQHERALDSAIRAERTMSMSCPSCNHLIEVVVLVSLRQ